MEQLQNSGILELVRGMTQKNLNSLTETIRIDQRESGGFRKELEEQTKAAQSETAEQTEGSKSAENTAETGKKGKLTSEDAEETLETEQAVMQQLIAAGVVNFAPMANKVVPREETVVTAVDVNARAELIAAAKEADSIRLPEQGTTQPGQEAVVQTNDVPAAESETVNPAETLVQTETVPVETRQSETQQNETRFSNTETAPQTAEKEKFEVTDVAEGAQPVFESVNEIPVKVGETTELRQTAETADVEEQVEVKISGALEQGESKVEIRLTPEYLGTVKVELTRSEDGTLHIVLNAENSQTSSLLEKHSGNLQNLLMASGQERVQVEVQNTQESQQHQQQDLADGRNGNQQGGQQENQQQSRRNTQDSQVFLQQLRLGLIPLDDEEES